nr:uncharacterized protein LOC113713388 [Coffea arabica]
MVLLLLKIPTIDRCWTLMELQQMLIQHAIKHSHAMVHNNAKETEGCQISDCGSANSIVEDGGDELKMGQIEQNSGSKGAAYDASYNKMDVHRIRERLKKRRLDRGTEKKSDIG